MSIIIELFGMLRALLEVHKLIQQTKNLVDLGCTRKSPFTSPKSLIILLLELTFMNISIDDIVLLTPAITPSLLQLFAFVITKLILECMLPGDLAEHIGQTGEIVYF